MPTTSAALDELSQYCDMAVRHSYDQYEKHGTLLSKAVTAFNDDSVWREKWVPDDFDVCDAASNHVAPNSAKGERVLSGAATFDEASSMCSKAATFQVLQFVCYGLAAVSAGAGVYLLATSGGHQAPTTGLTVHPQVGLGNGSLDVTYRF